MKMYRSVDILCALQEVLESNTLRHKEDFEIDKKIFNDAYDNGYRTIIWMSRPNGTHCFPEPEVYMQDSTAHNTYLFYAENNMTKGIRTFVAEIRKREYGVFYGNLYEMNYQAHAKRVAKNSGEYGYYEFHYEKGVVPVKRFKENPGQYHPELGERIGAKAYPLDSPELQKVLDAERTKRQKAWDVVPWETHAMLQGKSEEKGGKGI